MTLFLRRLYRPSGIIKLIYSENHIPIVAVGRRGRGHISPSASKGGERGCGNFLRHEIYTNFVSSVEAGMGMEG